MCNVLENRNTLRTKQLGKIAYSFFRGKLDDEAPNSRPWDKGFT